MSDELIFDSERQERRAKKKRRLIPLLVLAGILIAVVAIALIIRSRKEPVHTSGEDTPYPYTWQVQSDGSLLVEISHADAPDYRWTLADGDELRVTDAEREKKDKNNKTRFVLTPKEAGRDMVELKLLRETASVPAATEPASEEDARKGSYETPAPEDVIYKLTLLVEFTEEEDKLTGAVLSSSGVRCQGVETGGADSANPYQIYDEDTRFLVTEIKVSSRENDWTWEIVSGEDSVVFDGLVYDVGQVRLYLKAGQTPGESEVVLRSEAAEAEIRLRCILQEDGSLLVTEHQAQLREKPADAPVEDEEETGIAAAATVENGHEETREASSP